MTTLADPELQWEMLSGSYRTHKASVKAAFRHYMPSSKIIGVDQYWYRSLRYQGLNRILEYIRETSPPPMTAVKLRDLIHELGAPSLRGLPKASKAAAAVCVDGDHSPDVVVNVLGLKPYARCVWQNFMPVTIDPSNLNTTYPPSHAESTLYMLGEPVVEDEEDEEEELKDRVADQAQLIPAKYLFEAHRKMMPGMEIEQTDESYYMVNHSLAMEIIAADETDKQEYKPLRNDCDKFGRKLWANVPDYGVTAIGLVIDRSAGHAYCVLAMLPDNSDDISSLNLPVIRAFEPQTDSFVELGQGDYTATSGRIIW